MKPQPQELPTGRPLVPGAWERPQLQAPEQPPLGGRGAEPDARCAGPSRAVSPPRGGMAPPGVVQGSGPGRHLAPPEGMGWLREGDCSAGSPGEGRRREGQLVPAARVAGAREELRAPGLLLGCPWLRPGGGIGGAGSPPNGAAAPRPLFSRLPVIPTNGSVLERAAKGTFLIMSRILFTKEDVKATLKRLPSFYKSKM